MKKLTWPAPWKRLADAAGGIDRLGVMLAVKRRTLQRWALGESSMRAPAQAMVITLAKTLGVRSPVGEADAADRTGALFPTIDVQTVHTRYASALHSPEMKKHLDKLAAADVAARSEAQRQWRKRRARKLAKRAARSAVAPKARVSEVATPVSKKTQAKRQSAPAK